MEATLNGPFGQVVLGSTPLSIGRASDNQLVLDDSKVSSHHAEIRLQGQGYVLIDLGSSNGTLLNEQRLDAYVPRLLHASDVILVGDTRFTFEMPDMFSGEPTVYAGLRQVGQQDYPPSGATPPAPTNGSSSSYSSPYASAGSEPFAYPSNPPYSAAPATGYGFNAQSAGYQTPPPPPAAGSEPSIYPPGSLYSGAPAPAPTRPPRRRGLLITLGAFGGVLLIGLVILAGVVYANRSTTTKTLNAFCTAIKSGDYQTAYNQLSNGLQSKIGSEAQFANSYFTYVGLGKITNCTVSNADDSAGKGTITNTLADGSTVVDDYILVNENGAWKINSQQPRSTPALTLHTYCEAIKGGDYQMAYNQLSSTAQSQQSEAQFAANFSSGQTDCTVDQVNDATSTVTVTYTYSSGLKLTADYSLVNENGTWKINAQRLVSTPTLTLLTYCNALERGNYSVALNQWSSSFQSQITEAQWEANFSGNYRVTNCTVTNVNDTAGTGTINFAYAYGGTRIVDFTLIDENSNWKLQQAQPHSTPAQTLLDYCSALVRGNYPVAYNQLAGSVQSQFTEAQFATAFSSNKVTNCTVTNVVNATSTGTINFTYASGATRVFDFVLINENGAWKIQKGQARS